VTRGFVQKAVDAAIRKLSREVAEKAVAAKPVETEPEFTPPAKALSTIAEVETREAFEAWVESEDSREWIPKSFERFPEDDSALAGDYKLCSVELPWRAFLAGVDWREAR
jgi:hypothetical protein